MGNRVYDPIHDVFQNKSEQEDVPPNEKLAGAEAPYPEEEDGDSTQSDDNATPMNESEPHKRRTKEPSKYMRHLKKPDGEFFTRKDIQFEFLHELCSDRRALFTNRYQDFFTIAPTEESEPLNVTDESYVARKFIKNEKLTFSEYYLLTIASSTKCSKILRDKLLFDRNVAFSTCALSLLVNTGRLNTTINFFLEMTSQLRTFHSIPCLQRDARDPKSLQDTPRLKSILKNLPLGNENLPLTEYYEAPVAGKRLDSNPVNLMFHLCDNVALVNLKFIQEYISGASDLSFFDILENPDYDPSQRAQILLWLVYVHLETDMTDSAIEKSLELFEVDGKFKLESAPENVDIDTPEEVEFGESQKTKRREFLVKNNRLAHDGYRRSDANRPLMEQTRLDNSSAEDVESIDEDKSFTEKTPSRAVQRANQRASRRTGQKPGPKPGAKAAARALAPKRQSRKHAREQANDSMEEEHMPETTSKLEDEGFLAEEEPKLQVQLQSQSQRDYPEALQAPAKKKQKRKTGPAAPASQVQRNEALDEKKKDEMEALIEFDKSEEVAQHRTQDALMQELERAQALTRRKREELGLVKMFYEFEDVTMATVIGVRGKKRKKFKDGLLGFETDFIRTISGAKRAMLTAQHDANEDIYEFK